MGTDIFSNLFRMFWYGISSIKDGVESHLLSGKQGIGESRGSLPSLWGCNSSFQKERNKLYCRSKQWGSKSDWVSHQVKGIIQTGWCNKHPNETCIQDPESYLRASGQNNLTRSRLILAKFHCNNWKISTCYQASRPLKIVRPVCLLSVVVVNHFKRKGSSFEKIEYQWIGQMS